MAKVQAPTKTAPPAGVKPAGVKPAANTGAEGEEEKQGREDFLTGLSKQFKASSVDADGKLKVVPTIFVGAADETPADSYNFRKHAPLKRGSFATEADFLDFKSQVMRIRANAMVERADEMAKRAADARKYGDPETRKAMAKREKLQKQLAELDETLAKQGISVEEAQA